MDRDSLLRRLSALDFYVIDLHLYLNTHPNDREALAKYNEAVAESEALAKEYEKSYGMLSMHRQSSYPWQWIADPWPWQKEFNFQLAGDDM